jgi:hypothetical protein
MLLPVLWGVWTMPAPHALGLLMLSRSWHTQWYLLHQGQQQQGWQQQTSVKVTGEQPQPQQQPRRLGSSRQQQQQHHMRVAAECWSKSCIVHWLLH